MLAPCLTEAEFILALEETEVLELSRLTDPLAPTIDSAKVAFALKRAHDMIQSSYIISSRCGKAMIALNCQQLTIWLARYFMDTTKSRPFVEEDYNKARELLDTCKCYQDKSCPISKADITEILGTDATSSALRCGTRAQGCRLTYKKRTGILKYDTIYSTDEDCGC
jgi:hypothetical protein